MDNLRNVFNEYLKYKITEIDFIVIIIVLLALSSFILFIMFKTNSKWLNYLVIVFSVLLLLLMFYGVSYKYSYKKDLNNEMLSYISTTYTTEYSVEKVIVAKSHIGYDCGYANGTEFCNKVKIKLSNGEITQMYVSDNDLRQIQVGSKLKLYVVEPNLKEIFKSDYVLKYVDNYE